MQRLGCEAVYHGSVDMKEHLTEVLEKADDLIRSLEEVGEEGPDFDKLVLLREMLDLCSVENESRILSMLKRLANEGRWNTIRLN